MSKKLIQFLKNVCPSGISSELELLLYQLLQETTLKKKEQLLKMNEPCKKVWFIEKGLFRCYREYKGQQENIWFMQDGDVMFDPQSFYSGKPSKHVIEAVEVSIVSFILVHQLEDIYEKFPEFERIGRLLTQYYYVLSLENWEALASGTIKDRYKHFLATYPGLDERLSVKDIASFLKCSERTLRRFMKKGKS